LQLLPTEANSASFITIVYDLTLHNSLSGESGCNIVTKFDLQHASFYWFNCFGVRMAKTKEAMKIARQIIELEGQIEPLKKQLANLQKQFATLVQHTHEAPASNLTVTLRDIFKNAPEETFSLVSLAEKLPGSQAPTIRSTVSRLVKSQFVEPVGRGQYRLKSADSSEDLVSDFEDEESAWGPDDESDGEDDHDDFEDDSEDEGEEEETEAHNFL
jgi:hypothetical protein